MLTHCWLLLGSSMDLRWCVSRGKTVPSQIPLIIHVKGENERILGEVIKEESVKDPSYRSKLFLCTKFGSYWDPPNFGPGDHVRILQRSDPAYVRQQCEASLKNLGVDYIDLYYQNRMVKDAETSVEDTWKAMVELQKEGKIKYLGLSEADEEYIRRVSKVAKIDALQVEVSLISGALTRKLIISCSFRRSPLTSKPTGFWRLAGS